MSVAWCAPTPVPPDLTDVRGRRGSPATCSCRFVPHLREQTPLACLEKAWSCFFFFFFQMGFRRPSPPRLYHYSSPQVLPPFEASARSNFTPSSPTADFEPRWCLLCFEFMTFVLPHPFPFLSTLLSCVFLFSFLSFSLLPSPSLPSPSFFLSTFLLCSYLGRALPA